LINHKQIMNSTKHIKSSVAQKKHQIDTKTKVETEKKRTTSKTKLGTEANKHSRNCSVFLF
jgi:hypothetical protein